MAKPQNLVVDESTALQQMERILETAEHACAGNPIAMCAALTGALCTLAANAGSNGEAMLRIASGGIEAVRANLTELRAHADGVRARGQN